MRRFYWLSLLILVGCAPLTAVNSPALTPIGIIAEADSVAAPTPTLVSVAVEALEEVETAPTPSRGQAVATVAPDLDEAALSAELIVLMTKTLQAERGVDTPFAGYEGMVAFALPTDSQLWLVHSLGFRAFDPHFVALFKREGGGWLELGHEVLEQSDNMQEGSVTTVEGNGRLWLEVVTGVDVQGGCYHLLRVEQIDLVTDAINCTLAPTEADGLADLNNDGLLDLILNYTDAYVFCYDCGVRFPQFGFRTWTGTEWQELQLATLVGDNEATTLNNQAVLLAQAGLWKEASEAIVLANSLDPNILWNQIMIEWYVQAHIELIGNDGFPFLQHIFYGDLEEALNEMRLYSVAELFSVAENRMIIGTPAEGWPDILGDWMLESINPALSVHPDWATAYFFRGWATYQIWDEDPAVLVDIERAAMLAPDEPLFSESAAFLRGE